MMKRIYIEGENTQNLRTAFYKLFKKELAKNMPRIVLGDGISQTIDKFRYTPKQDGEERFLLIDSDEPLTDKADLVRRVNTEKCNQKNCIFEATVDNTFFMVQEVEAWILSQPEVLQKRKITKGLPLNNIPLIDKPSEKLSDIYKKNNKKYNKTREFSAVFENMDSKKLMDFSPEYKDLIEKLK